MDVGDLRTWRRSRCVGFALRFGEKPSVRPYDPTITGPRVACDSRDIDQCSLYIGLPIFGRDDPDRFALRIMNDVLGAGMSSRLFREVRERRGLAYSVGSGYGFLDDAGVMTISAGVNREKLAETIEVCLEETWKMGRMWNLNRLEHLRRPEAA